VIPAWIAFLIVISLVLIFSKKELGIILSIGTIMFALLTQINLIDSFLAVITNPSIVILAIAVALIPILGGIMEESGLMVELIQKMKISKKASLIVSPAFFGLLPVPGGALMSAPIVDQIDPNINVNQKVAINVWYRHALILIYPLSTILIVGSVLAGISLYVIVVAMIIPFIIMVIVGYFTMLRNVDMERVEYERDLKRVFRNLMPIIIAPIIDFLGRSFFNLSYPEIFLLIGLIFSIVIALNISKMPLSSIKDISKKMKIWRFPLLIIAIFWFLEVFIRSGLPEDIGALKLPFIIFLLVGFFLGFATGRTQLPLSILIPIYLIQNVFVVMPLIDFVFLYSATFLGYIVTPIHPCVAYSINYLKTDYKSVFKHLAIPTFICLSIVFGSYILVFSIF
jgi:integral membrane protein (TIGR00529 family)